MSETIQLHPSTLHTAEQFYAFFSMIPEERWTSGVVQNVLSQRCARGHLGYAEVGTVMAPCLSSYRLSELLKCPESVINDGCDPRYQQPTPRQRILAALRDKFSGTEAR